MYGSSDEAGALPRPARAEQAYAVIREFSVCRLNGDQCSSAVHPRAADKSWCLSRQWCANLGREQMQQVALEVRCARTFRQDT